MTESKVGGFAARSVTTLGSQPLAVPEIPGDFKATDGDWVRYTLVNVDGEPLLVVTGVLIDPPSDNVADVMRTIEISRRTFLPKADAVIDSINISP